MIRSHAVPRQHSFVPVQPQPLLILGTLTLAFALMCIQVLLQLRGASDFLTDIIALSILTGALAFAQVLDRRTGIIGAVLAGAVAAIVPGVPTIPPRSLWEIVVRLTAFVMMGTVYYMVIVALRTRDEYVKRQLADLRALHAAVRDLRAVTDHAPIDPTIIHRSIVEAATHLGGAWRSRLILVDEQGAESHTVAIWPPDAARADGPSPATVPISADAPYVVSPDAHGGSRITLALTGKHRPVGVLEVEYRENGAGMNDAADLLAVYARDAELTLAHVALRERFDHLRLFEERARIARELHDGLVQSLGGIGYRLEYFRQTLTVDTVMRVREELETAGDEVRHALRDARQMIYDLRHVWSSEDIAARLRALLDTVAGETGLIVSTDLPDALPPLPLEHGDAIVAVAREALQNVVRHARAEAVALALLTGPGYVELTISDDGCGFTAEERAMRETPLRYGLLGMTERAAQQGGSLTIQTAPEMGTCVTLTLPVESGNS